MSISQLYTPNNVQVGQSVLYVAPANTPMPTEQSLIFDPTNWVGKLVTSAGATSATFTVVTSAGSQTSASFTFTGGTAAALQTLLQGLSNVGVGKVVVTGASGGPYTVVFDNSLGAVTLTATGTGGTPTVVGGLWVPAGGTEAGWTFGASKNTQDIRIEEQSTPIATTIQDQSVTIASNLAEDTPQQWSWALNAVKTVVAPGVGQAGLNINTLSDDLIQYACALESKNRYGLPTRIYVPVTVAVDSLSVAYRRAANPRLLNVTFHSVCATSAIQVREVSAQGT